MACARASLCSKPRSRGTTSGWRPTAGRPRTSRRGAARRRAGRELADLTGRLERAVSEARTRSLAREETDRKASDALAALEKLEEELEAARTDALRAAGERVAARNARHEVDLAVERLAAGATRLEEGRIKLARELEERGRDLAAAAREEASLRETARAGGETVRQLAAEIAAIVRGLSEMETAREDARASLATLEEREAALVEAARARDGALGAIREVLTAAGVAHDATLADRLRPGEGWDAGRLESRGRRGAGARRRPTGPRGLAA